MIRTVRTVSYAHMTPAEVLSAIGFRQIVPSSVGESWTLDIGEGREHLITISDRAESDAIGWGTPVAYGIYEADGSGSVAEFPNLRAALRDIAEDYI